MSFSSETKKELSSINNFAKKELLEAELIGYLMSGNSKEEADKIEFITENEFNIERLYKILFKLKIEYEPEIERKVYVAKMSKVKLRNIEELTQEEEKKALESLNKTLKENLKLYLDLIKTRLSDEIEK